MNPFIRRRLLMLASSPIESKENWNIDYLASNGLPDTNLFTFNINGDSQKYSIENNLLVLDSDYETGYIELLINNSLIRKNITLEIKFYQSSSYNNYAYGTRLFILNKNKSGVITGLRTNGGLFNYTGTDTYGGWLSALVNGTTLNTIKINIVDGVGEILLNGTRKLADITLADFTTNKVKPHTFLSGILISQVKIYISEIKFYSI